MFIVKAQVTEEINVTDLVANPEQRTVHLMSPRLSAVYKNHKQENGRTVCHRKSGGTINEQHMIVT